MSGPPPSRGVRLRLLGLAISAVSLAAVVVWASGQEAPTFPSSLSQITALLGAICAYGLATALRAERWLRLLGRSGARARRSDCYALTAVGFMGNNVLPARGGDGMRVYLMAPRARTGMRTVLGTLVAERVLDLVTLLALFWILVYGVLRGIDAPRTEALALVAALAVGAAAIAALALTLGRRSARWRRLVDFIRPMVQATRDLRGLHALVMVALTLLVWGAEAVTYLLVSDAVRVEMTPLESLYLIGLASIFVLIPSGPGYAGTLDAAVVFGIRAIGAGGAAAVSYLLMLRFVLLIPITLAGLALLLLRYGWRPGSRPAGAEAGGT